MGFIRGEFSIFLLCFLCYWLFGADDGVHRLGPNIIRVLPSTCVTFLVYENTKIYLPGLFEKSEETTTTHTNEEK